MFWSKKLYPKTPKGGFKYTGLNKIITKNLGYYNKKYSSSEIQNAILVLRNYDLGFQYLGWAESLPSVA